MSPSETTSHQPPGARVTLTAAAARSKATKVPAPFQQDHLQLPEPLALSPIVGPCCFLCPQSRLLPVLQVGFCLLQEAFLDAPRQASSGLFKPLMLSHHCSHHCLASCPHLLLAGLLSLGGQVACLVHSAQLWNFHVYYFIDPVLPSLSTNRFTMSLCAGVCLSAGGVGSDVLSCGGT